MTLSKSQIIDTALAILGEHGLASLSMRQLAGQLEVQPGALYWHIKNKQELLALLADRIIEPALSKSEDSQVQESHEPVAPEPRESKTRKSEEAALNHARQKAISIRRVLLEVRDSAEVVTFAQAYRNPEQAPMRIFHEILAEGLPPDQALWGARTLVHYILGAITEEQNYAALADADLVTSESNDPYSEQAFLFGVDAILRGIAPRSSSAQDPMITLGM